MKIIDADKLINWLNETKQDPKKTKETQLIYSSLAQAIENESNTIFDIDKFETDIRQDERNKKCTACKQHLIECTKETFEDFVLQTEALSEFDYDDDGNIKTIKIPAKEWQALTRTKQKGA